jgi:DNA-3-methyladenine glycosylase I
VTGAVAGPDGRLRCPWATSTPDYVAYHDEEWGRSLSTNNAMFERMTLEGFQSGLSWLIILRKRPGFRKAFDNFSMRKIAAYDGTDVERLLADAGIVRNRAKIEATISNARVGLQLPGGILGFVSGYAPAKAVPAPRRVGEVPSTSVESIALSKDLKRRGMRFVGPTTMYALMQATGLVNDHLADCWCR